MSNDKTAEDPHDVLRRLWSRCPFGYVNGNAILHRSTEMKDIISWLQQMDVAIAALSVTSDKLHCEPVFDFDGPHNTICRETIASTPVKARTFITLVQHPLTKHNVCLRCADTLRRLIGELS